MYFIYLAWIYSFYTNFRISITFKKLIVGKRYAFLGRDGLKIILVQSKNSKRVDKRFRIITHFDYN